LVVTFSLPHKLVAGFGLARRNCCVLEDEDGQIG
jgi:hypothetical protein